MGGEGSMMHMITSLKNNKRRQKYHKPFHKRRDATHGTSKPVYDFPEATPEILAKIKSEMIKDQKSQLVKTVAIFIVLVLLIIYIIA